MDLSKNGCAVGFSTGIAPHRARSAGADGAAAGARAGAGIDDGLPAVSMGAAPEDLLMAADGDLLGRERRVFLRVPLGRKRGPVALRAERFQCFTQALRPLPDGIRIPSGGLNFFLPNGSEIYNISP